MPAFHIGWTTVSTQAQGEALAQLLVEKQLAVCVQLEGPLVAYYKWEGALQKEPEYRLTVKFLSPCGPAIEALFAQSHPYQTPQWIVVEAAHVGKAYAQWAASDSSGLRGRYARSS